MRNCVNSCRIYTACLSPALNGSSEIRHFERSDAIEIHNGIILFDFYTGLTHIRKIDPAFSFLSFVVSTFLSFLLMHAHTQCCTQ